MKYLVLGLLIFGLSGCGPITAMDIKKDPARWCERGYDVTPRQIYECTKIFKERDKEAAENPDFTTWEERSEALQRREWPQCK